MQVIHPDMLGDLGDQMPAAERALGTRQPVDNRSRHIAQNSAVINPLEFEYVSPSERMRELMEFMAF